MGKEGWEGKRGKRRREAGERAEGPRKLRIPGNFSFTPVHP